MFLLMTGRSFSLHPVLVLVWDTLGFLIHSFGHVHRFLGICGPSYADALPYLMTVSFSHRKICCD